MKKILTILLIVVLAFSCLIGCGQEKETDKQVINVVYHPTFGGSTAISVADKLGYFAEEGLEINYTVFTSGPPEIAAMAAGEQDIGFIGSGAAWLAFSGQVNIIALDNIALTEEIVVRANSGINSIADLKGKTIAVQEGAAGYTLLLVALEDAGLKVSDVKIMNISNDNLPSTYNDSSIDCWAGWMPSTTSLKTALGSNAKVLANNASYPTAAFPSTWVANKDFVKNHPDLCQKFVNALTKAQIWRSEHEETSCEYASIRAGQVADDLKAQIGSAKFPSQEEFANYYNTSAFVDMLEQLRTVQSEKVTGSVPMSEVYIDTFAKEAIK